MILYPEIENYLQEMAPLPHPVLEEMEAVARERRFPIVGPQVGRLLALLIQFGHVHTVLECGSGFGYSAFWMALALSENGRITCIETDGKNVEQGRMFLEKANLSHKVKFIEGDAMTVVGGLNKTYDLIVNDVDKHQYLPLFPQLFDRLRTGGMLVTDNVLWRGQVAAEAQDETTRSIQKYNQELLNHPRLWNSILPVRDGVALSMKLRAKKD